MKIKKVINNNVVLSQMENGKEYVLLGRGLGFNKNSGDDIPVKSIEKKFIYDNENEFSMFDNFNDEIPLKYFDVAERILDLAKSELNFSYLKSSVLSLADHIYFLVQRSNNKLFITNDLLHEISRVHIIEFNVAKKAMNIITNEFYIEPSDDEVAYIAMHIINANVNFEVDNFYEYTKISDDILSIIENSHHITFKDSEFDKIRLVTHVRSLVQRILFFHEYNNTEIEKSLYLQLSNNEEIFQDVNEIIYKN